MFDNQGLTVHEKLTNDSYKYVLFCSSLRVLTSIYSNIVYIHRVGRRHSCLLGLFSYHYRPTVDPLSDHPDLVDWMATLVIVHSRNNILSILAKMGLRDYNSDEWRLFIDSSK